MRVIFLGSTDFSLPILREINDHFELIGLVIVKPKPRGRGLKTVLPKTALWAQERGVSVYDPELPNDRGLLDRLTILKPDIFVLAAYGHILSGEFLRIARLGGVNIHPSLLPKYRGAAPIQRAIMAGEKTTGLTIFFMDEKIDHGDIVFQKELPIEEYDDFGTLSEKLATLAAAEIPGVLHSIADGSCPRIRQDDKGESLAPKIKKEEMVIDWRLSARQILNLIRSLAPSPGARTFFRTKELIITRAAISETPHHDDQPLSTGLFHINKKNLYATTGEGSLILEELKPENKKKISGLDFINGFRVKEGEKIE
jgi:methionyl-tRNA formyltransferase